MQIPQLKRLTCLAGPGSLLVSLDPGRRVTLEDPDATVLTLLRLLSRGEFDLAQLQQRLEAAGHAVPAQELAGVLDQLDAMGWLQDRGAPERLDPHERERFASNLAFFDAFTSMRRHREEFQHRLRAARVLLLGAGGLGSAVLQSLVGLGVGEVSVVDFDTVELKNLSRQFAYAPAHIGHSKVHELAAWARRFSDLTAVHPVHRRIDGVDDVRDLLPGADLVVSAVDTPADVDAWVNEAAVSAGTPLIRGGLSYLHGFYWSVAPGRSSCHACLERYRELHRDRLDPEAGRWPVVLEQGSTNRATGPIAQVLGGLVAMEATRYLTGTSAPAAAGTYQLIDFATDCSTSSESWPQDPDCAVCATARRSAP